MIKRLGLTCALVLLLSSCYVPARFDTELEVSRNGFYHLVFHGYLVDIGLYRDLKENKITPSEEREKIAILKTDFERDDGTKEFSYYKQGHFKVVYDKKGDIFRTKMFTFIRRNENMLSITYDKKKGRISVASKYIKQIDAQRLRDIGLWMEGELKLKTDARVISHNATEVKKDGYSQILIWRIKSPFDPAVKVEMSIF